MHYRPHRFIVAVSLALAALCAPFHVSAQAAATGTVEGRVLDPRRGEYLENARVTIEGSALTAFTDSTGQYRLTGLLPGPAKLSFFFTGLGIHTELVTVVAGQTIARDVSFTGGGKPGAGGTDGVVKLDAFRVSTSKEMDGAAIAINEQRFARNIMNVVSADEFGAIADGSIGEFMKFLPGITSDYTGGDARRFSINGAPADNVPISMGGFDMASAAGAGTRRAVELDQVSINNIARIEINRSPTPDTSGSALAGAVNFVPRSAFERNRPSYSYTASFLMKDSERAFGRKSPGPWWGQETYKIHPGLDVSAVVPVTKNFGFTVSAGASLQYTAQPFTGMQWVGANLASNATAVALTGRPATTPDNPYLAIFQWRDSGKNTSRQNFSTTVDWKPARHDRLSFGFSYGMLREKFATRVQTFQINRVVPLNWGQDHTWSSSSVFTPASNINSAQMSLVNSGRIRPGRTVTPTLRWLHEGPIWKSDAGVAYGHSRIHYQDIDKGSFNGATMQRNNLQILFDDIFYLQPGKITVRDHNGAIIDPSKLENYSIVSANSNRQRTYDTTRQAYYNLRRDFRLGENLLTLKAGADIRTKVRDLRGPAGNLETHTYVGADRTPSTTPFTTAGLPTDDSPLRFLDVPYSRRMPDFGIPQQQHVDNIKLFADTRANPTHWTRNANNDYTALTNSSKRAEEIISAGFLRGDLTLLSNRLRLVGGVRAEQTNIDAEGPLSDPTRNFRRDANGDAIRVNNVIQLIEPAGSLAALQRTLVERGTHAKKEYLRLFPSLNASYTLSDSLVARVAYSQSVGRPDFNQYSGGVILPDIENLNANSRINVNNASIRAWQAETYMARVEYYFGSVGNLSAGAFIRDYQNFFQTVTSVVTPSFLDTFGLDEAEYGTILVVTQFNNPARVRQRGFEIEYKHVLTFLPPWARGLQVFANISSQRAKGTDNLQDMNPFTANFGFSFTREKFNIRVNENYRGIQRRGVVTGASIEPGTYTYFPKRLYVDVTGGYNLRKNLSVFFALRNVRDANEDTKVYGANTPDYARFRQRASYGSLWTAGVTGTF